MGVGSVGFGCERVGGGTQKKAHTKWRNVADFTHSKQKTTRAYTNNKKMHSGLVSVDDGGATEVLRLSFPSSLHLFSVGGNAAVAVAAEEAAVSCVGAKTF